MKRDLEGQRLVITGAARGVGEQVARIAAKRGARVAVLGLEPDRLAMLAEGLGHGSSWHEADVLDSESLKSAIDASSERLGGIDLVLANAGIVSNGTIRRADESAFERVIDVNVNGTFRTLKHVTPHLEQSHGHAMVVASALSFLVLPSMASYSASKAGVEMLTLAYRQEVAHLGISAGLVHPSWIDTDLVKGADADLPSFAQMRRKLPYPGNVTTTVDVVAEAIVDGLVSRAARVYVPRAVGAAGWMKAALASPAAWLWSRQFAAKWVPALEREIAELGRNNQAIPPASRTSG
jgi:NAD(P)-dependent dehydrogenase (short-subunit alcohol dehydrogenase family)